MQSDLLACGVHCRPWKEELYITRIVPVITLVTLLRTMMNYTTVREISTDEAGNGTSEKMFSVVLPVVIESFTLSTGKDILFDEGGSVFDKTTSTISGEIEGN